VRFIDRYSNHFLDSCAIIGKILEFDEQHRCATIYYKKQYIRHTSNRVEKEIKGRFNGLRGELLSFFNWISIKSFYGMATDENIRRFLSKYRLHDWNRNYSSLNRFFSQYMAELKSYLLDKKDSTLDNLKQVVINAISKALTILYNMKQGINQPKINCHMTPNDYTAHYSHEFSGVQKVVRYEKDVLVLLDSYYVKNQIINNDVGFITTDFGDILSKKTEIEKELPGIYIFDMKNPK